MHPKTVQAPQSLLHSTILGLCLSVAAFPPPSSATAETRKTAGAQKAAGARAALASAPCAPQKTLQSAQLRKVYDGDTLFTSRRGKVRVLGLNTPELEGPYTRAEPLGDAARRAAVNFLRGERRIYLETGAQTRDRHGRRLAYIYRQDGRSLTQALLQQGLGFLTAIPPELRHLECLQAAERQARQKRLGVWKHPYFAARPARSIDAGDAGFRRISGRVRKFSPGHNSWWLELDGPVVILIPKKSMRHFPGGPDSLASLVGRDIVVRGWLQDRSGSRAARRGYKPMLLALHHPAMLESPSL